MSFSSNVKKELVSQCGKSRHCQIAELAGLFFMVGHMRDGRPVMDTDNALVLEKYAVLMKKAFGINAEETLSDEELSKFSQALRLESADGGERLPADGLILQQECCRRAYIRGAFVASGTVSDPNKSYHFEIACRTQEQAGQLRELMQGFGFDAKTVLRRHHFVVYLKEGEQIVDILSVMGAYVSLMDLENVRILREMRGAVNRKVNCETANINKTVSAAVAQIEDIHVIEETIGLDALPEPLQEMAQARLSYPEATLAE
ncbi:MAG: DNA-binding protein WhiA, partial [Clostridiales bacterium]|nr:DNA-binding protein WhiA [Clostridiales bacterium]